MSDRNIIRSGMFAMVLTLLSLVLGNWFAQFLGITGFFYHYGGVLTAGVVGVVSFSLGLYLGDN